MVKKPREADVAGLGDPGSLPRSLGSNIADPLPL
jgi:hypothetical protein